MFAGSQFRQPVYTVNLLQYLTERLAMTAFVEVNYRSAHSKFRHINGMVRFTPRLHCHTSTSHGYLWSRRVGRTLSRSGGCKEERNLLPHWESKHDSSEVQPVVQSTLPNGPLKLSLPLIHTAASYDRPAYQNGKTRNKSAMTYLRKAYHPNA